MKLAKNLYCVQMRSGVEIWIEQEKVSKLQNVLTSLREHKFLFFNDQTINTADVVGVFKAETMEAYIRRRNGQWICKEGTWHERGQKCECVNENKQKEMEEYRNKFIEEHGFEPLR